MKIEPFASFRPDSRRRLRRVAVPAAVVAALLLLVGLVGIQLYLNRASRTIERPTKAAAAALPKALAEPNAFKPLTVDQAIEANAELPFATRKDDPARQFVLKVDSDDRGRAVDCLAKAVYYEAASEGADGQRAVAQVVLNRMRHPGYPSSVCGVVYQGSERVMGCQFTFTCDGSLLRTPNTAMFSTARRIAVEALAGHVFAPVGHATNYHADYVLPYWADSLDKQVKIGRHIFYRLKGGLGSSSAFGQRYAGREPAVAPPRTMTVTGETLSEAGDALAPNAGPTASDRPAHPIIAADAAGDSPLAADAMSGALLIDNGAPAAAKKKVASTKDCPAKDLTKILPTAPNELRATATAGC